MLPGPKHLKNGLSDFMLASSTTVRNISVMFDQDMSFKQHINQVCKKAFFHLRNISKMRSITSQGDAEKLIQAFVSSRLDYCNVLLTGYTKDSLNIVQLIHEFLRKYRSASAEGNPQERSRLSCVSLPPLASCKILN